MRVRLTEDQAAAGRGWVDGSASGGEEFRHEGESVIDEVVRLRSELVEAGFRVHKHVQHEHDQAEVARYLAAVRRRDQIAERIVHLDRDVYHCFNK